MEGSQNSTVTATKGRGLARLLVTKTDKAPGGLAASLMSKLGMWSSILGYFLSCLVHHCLNNAPHEERTNTLGVSRLRQ